MGFRNFQSRFSVLDKIASQPHTITLASWVSVTETTGGLHTLARMEWSSGWAPGHSPWPSRNPPHL